MSDTASGTTNRRQVLVTGAAGRIGTYFARHHNRDRYGLRLMVREEDDAARVDAIRPFGEVMTGDISDLEALKGFCGGIDTVIHLAGGADPSATWSSLLDTNIAGTFHVFAAAKAAGCRRVVYASSIHAVSGYRKDVQVKTNEPVNPGDLYGVTKCFGEALARYMAEQEGLSAIAIRIGAFQPLEAAQGEGSVAMMDAFVSERDLRQLLEKCIDAPDTLRFTIAHGLSNNHFKRLDLSDTRERLGYAPQDDLTAVNPRLRDLHFSETITAHNLQDEGQTSGLREETEGVG